MAFSDRQLQTIGDTPEIVIETRAGSRSYPTVIWVVVDDGEVFVRSVRGERGEWYQRALANPEVILAIGGTRIEARAVPATDQDSVTRCSVALQRKYRQGRSLDAMLKPEILDTTLRLDPA